MARSPQDVVALYLRGQNLEHVRKIDEAIAFYEEAVAARFDAAGPYDRLIAIYRAREQHADVERVATAAIASVRTFGDKLDSYKAIQAGARDAVASAPDRRGAEF